MHVLLTCAWIACNKIGIIIDQMEVYEERSSYEDIWILWIPGRMHMNTCLSIAILQLLTYFIIAINYTYINPIAPKINCLGLCEWSNITPYMD